MPVEQKNNCNEKENSNALTLKALLFCYCFLRFRHSIGFYYFMKHPEPVIGGGMQGNRV